ncbi:MULTISPECIES: DUF1127 domain-containing protein [Pseudomonas fluorescens group]|uniref:YjiS-like domain-containing protein n=2 Tax=Pseudomonas marginalis TaxID=298 RepID=A0A3M4AWV3_PSEMA|nr:DUF1127 domain-containing protein [Pseudomonas marginalis]MCF5667723.1 DUF1127 domain-containing protein [Pseudomonas marginalis]OAJ49156.1 hypothetical protein AO064_13980 [Pseudomonas marginalis]RMO60309.1 hypothetical protein ALQ38_200015 [Pseudomonas marginalis pv. marginalis]RMP11302.1 hypothetical protein ALQ29_00150 [Pseudomonas marginalis pv. marginalis]
MDTTSPLYKRLPRQVAFAFVRWARLAYERRQLSQLDARELSDLGISHGDRIAELSKPFWRD